MVRTFLWSGALSVEYRTPPRLGAAFAVLPEEHSSTSSRRAYRIFRANPGLSWQVVPALMDEMIRDKDETKLARVTEAFLKMKEFVLVPPCTGIAALYYPGVSAAAD